MCVNCYLTLLNLTMYKKGSAKKYSSKYAPKYSSKLDSDSDDVPKKKNI